MSPMLSDREKQVIATILAPYADQIDRVAVFGSRATGRAKASSDIDLVIYSNADKKLERRLWTLFNETNLSVAVDVVLYNHIKHAPLKSRIDAVALDVFDPSDWDTFKRATTAHQHG
jgi:uncharacterized protein